MTAVHTCTLAEPEQHELDRVAASRHPADAADGQAELRVAGEGRHHVQGDRLDRRPQ
jgi:hypothetical protein